jgi:hypothetical protein
MVWVAINVIGFIWWEFSEWSLMVISMDIALLMMLSAGISIVEMAGSSSLPL